MDTNFLEKFLFKNSDYYVIDEDGKKVLNYLGSKIYAFYLIFLAFGLIDKFMDSLKDEEFIKEIDKSINYPNK